jgi:ABC-type multidrug transport system ATPase subunit
MSLSGRLSPVIQVSGIRKTYGATVAVSDISFEVSEGETFVLISPNGAGKTTTMECVEGVRRPFRAAGPGEREIGGSQLGAAHCNYLNCPSGPAPKTPI